MPRTIFITDAASPLGRACAVRLGRAGWNLVLGGSSLSGLQGVCSELPDAATLPQRCDISDVDNVMPVLSAAEDRFGPLDAVLFNTRARGGWGRALNAQVTALARLGDLCAPMLGRSHGHFVIAGPRPGSRSLAGAIQTVARDATRTLADALQADWRHQPQRLSLVEPRGVDTPRDMARRIARVLNSQDDQSDRSGAQAVA